MAGISSARAVRRGSGCRAGPVVAPHSTRRPHASRPPIAVRRERPSCRLMRPGSRRSPLACASDNNKDARGESEPESSSGASKEAVPIWNVGAWIAQQEMTPKRWLLAVIAGFGVLFVVQRVAVLGLVGLDRLLVAALIAAEEAIAAALFSALRTFGAAGAVAAVIYALYVFVIAEDTSKR